LFWTKLNHRLHHQTLNHIWKWLYI
jgi:hypothetical protein